jgi:ATPase subunit of ABC transporter with duplicated ATPase domains
LIRLLNGELQPQSGSVTLGGTIKIGYFPQNSRHLFEQDIDIVTWLQQFTDDQDINRMRAMLGRMLFSGDDVKKSVTVLSGGEKVRCLLSMLMLQEANLLILDEPTNHLDLESIEALQEALQSYPGSIIFVSHDREFVDQVADRVLVMTEDEGTVDWRGTYSDYRESRGLD